MGVGSHRKQPLARATGISQEEDRKERIRRKDKGKAMKKQN